jgi:hypothetical protein
MVGLGALVEHELAGLEVEGGELARGVLDLDGEGRVEVAVHVEDAADDVRLEHVEVVPERGTVAVHAHAIDARGLPAHSLNKGVSSWRTA